MADVHILAIDLAKRSFQVCATDPGGACVDAPGFARDFQRCNGVALQSVVCQASDRGLSATGPVCSSKNRGHIGSESLVGSSPGTGSPYSEH